MPFLAPFVAPLTAAVAAIKSIGFFGWLAQAGLLQGIVKAGFSMAANYVVGRLFGQQKPPAQASQLQTRYGDNLARLAVLGRVGTAGQHMFRHAYGKGNRTVKDVYKWSDCRVSEVRRFRGQGFWRTPPTAGGGQLPGINGYAHIENHFGTMDQVASAALVANSGGRWTSDARGAGVAYSVITTQLDRERLTQPLDPFAEVIGPYLYDWRKDDTAGGDGDDRWNDQDSWSGRRDNPVLQMYVLERGLYNGTELMVGKGASPSRLPLAEWTIGANICDEDAGEGRFRYSSSIIAEAGEGVTHDANMRPLLEACAASWIEGPSGQYPIVGAAQAVIATFTDEDIDFEEPFRWAAKRVRDQLVNTVAGSYTDPTLFYERSPIAARIETGARAEDGERLAVPLPFPAVTYPNQADELADIALRANRYQANAEICLKPKWLRIQPGRWVRWNSAKYGDRTYLVMQKSLGAFGGASVRKVYLTLQEVGSGIFTATGYETVPTSPAPPGTPDYQSELDNFLAQPWVLTSEATGERPAIRTSWDAIEDVTITGVEFEYWPTAQPEEVQPDSARRDVSVKFLTVGVISQTEYKVRYRLVADPQRAIPWVGPATVTTLSAAFDGIAKVSNLSPGVKDVLQSSFAAHNLADARAEQLALAGAEVASTVVEDRSVAVRFRNATAVAMQAMRAAIGVDPLTGKLTAVSEMLALLMSTVGNSEAGILWQMKTEVVEDGDVVARVVLQVRASVDDEWVNVATVWEAGFTDGDPDLPFGRIVLAANEIVVADGEGNVSALFDPAGIHILNAFIGQLTGDHIAFNTLTGNHIVALSIDSPSLAFGAVTEWGDLNYSDSKFFGNSANFTQGLTVVKSMTLDNPEGNPVLVTIDLTTRTIQHSTTVATIAGNIQVRKDGVNIQQCAIINVMATNNQSLSFWDLSGDTAPVYDIRTAFQATTSPSGSCTVQVESLSAVMTWKR